MSLQAGLISQEGSRTALTRHELKEQLQHDQFTDSVSYALNYASSHKQRLTQGAILAVIAAAIIGGLIWFNAHRRTLREKDLQAALAIVDAQVGPPNEYVKTFPTQDEKVKASIKVLAAVAAKDAGTREGFFAQYYLGTLKAQNNDLKGAETDLRVVANSGSESAPLAKIALAQLYINSKRTAEARELLHSLVNKPTDLVSKGQAQILLAQIEAPTNPAEAKKILNQLKTSKEDPAIARAADQLSSQLNK